MLNLLLNRSEMGISKKGNESKARAWTDVNGRVFKFKEKTGPYKRTQIASLRQAKFYLQRQTAALQRLIYWGDIWPQYMSHSTQDSLICRVIWPQYMSHSTQDSLIYCGSYTFEGSFTAVHEPQYMREKKSLVYCGASAVGVDAPQLESFYKVPKKFLN